MADRRDREPKRTPSQEASQYLGYGLTWALSTALFLFLGLRLDRWLGTMPLLTILGAFVGAGAGFYNLYFRLVIEPREREREAREGEKDGDQ